MTARRTTMPPIPPAVPRWATPRQAADYANIPIRTLRDWISNGILPAYRLGPRQLQLDLNDIDKLRVRVPTRGGDAA